MVAGARSALFLPYRDLGLIIVDEEHEAAYKQEDGVAYHARDMAVVRGRIENAPVILTSATPSLETRVNAERGRYLHLKLPERFGGRSLPQLALVDLKRDKPERGRWLSGALVKAIQDNLDAGEQSLLFLNRRGYAPLTLCRDCGHRFQCPNCSAGWVDPASAARWSAIIAAMSSAGRMNARSAMRRKAWRPAAQASSAWRRGRDAVPTGAHDRPFQRFSRRHGTS